MIADPRFRLECEIGAALSVSHSLDVLGKSDGGARWQRHGTLHQRRSRPVRPVLRLEDSIAQPPPSTEPDIFHCLNALPGECAFIQYT